MEYDVFTLSNNVTPRLNQSIKTLKDSKSKLNAIAVPSDFPEGRIIKSAGGKVDSICSILSNAQSSVTQTINNLNKASDSSKKAIGMIGEITTQVNKTLKLPETGNKITENGGVGFHKANGDCYSQIYVTKDGTVVHVILQYSGAIHDENHNIIGYEEGSIGGIKVFKDSNNEYNIHQRGCAICVETMLLESMGLIKEKTTSDAVKKVAVDSKNIQEKNGHSDMTSQEDMIDLFDMHNANPQCFDIDENWRNGSKRVENIENKKKVEKLLQQDNRPALIRVPAGTEFCKSSGHALGALEVIEENNQKKVAIANPSGREGKEGESKLYPLDYILDNASYVIVLDDVSDIL